MPPQPHPSGPPPSWSRPVLLGAAATILGMLVLGTAMGASGSIGSPVFAGCCAFAFVPFGILPARTAFRRDAALTAGQGFAVSFIAVGLGMAMWAVPVILEAPTPDPRAIRKTLAEWQEQLPPDSRMSAERLDESTRTAASVMPYLPALHAAWTSVLAGVIGMVTVARARRRMLPRVPIPPSP